MTITERVAREAGTYQVTVEHLGELVDGGLSDAAFRVAVRVELERVGRRIAELRSDR